MVDEPKVVPMWMGVVEGAVAKFKGDSAEEQEVICVGLGDEYGLEAADKARELFKAERAKLEPIDGARKPEPQEPEPEDEEEKKAAVKEAAVQELRKNVAGKPSFKITLLTADQQKERIAELAEIFQSDKTEERLRYNTRKAEIAEELEVQQMDVHRAVMLNIDKEKKEKKDLTQSQKV